MKLLWEYRLPLQAHPADHHYEGPLLAHAGRLFFPTWDFGPEPPGPRRSHLVTLHGLDAESGRGATHRFSFPVDPLPGCWSFAEVGGQPVLYCGRLLALEPRPHLFSEVREVIAASHRSAHRGELLVHAGRIYFTDQRTNALLCVDPASEKVVWSSHLGEIGSYRSGDPQLFEGQLACFGEQGLLILDPESGARLHSIRIPRIDKLYSPIADGDDLLLGYTNWSVGGVLRLHRSSGKVLWRYRRKFEGPASYCRIWRLGDLVVWVKGHTEIIGIDAATGEQRWAYPAAPYLYTELRFIDGDLLFGTAGADGYIQRVDGATGQARWRRFLRNGCSSFGLFAGSVMVGDFDHCLRRLDLSTGDELDRLDLGAEVVGDVLVSGERVFTVIWGTEEHPPRLVCVSLA